MTWPGMVSGSIETLRRELELAREENRYLREAMVPSPLVQYDFHISRSERALLEALLAMPGVLDVEQLRRFVDVALGRLEIASTKTVHIAICRLRARLRVLPVPIVIGGQYGRGYFLDEVNKARLRAVRHPAAPA